jgi:hypothetical protein
MNRFFQLLCLVGLAATAFDSPAGAHDSDFEAIDRSVTHVGYDAGVGCVSKKNPFTVKQFISIFSLIGDPKKYEGAEVYFPAVWSTANGHGREPDRFVFATADDARAFESLNGIEVELRGNVKPEIANGSRVHIRGIFHAALPGEGCVGKLDTINIEPKDK